MQVECSGQQRRRGGHGVRTLEDIRIRCRVDDLTGCWNWSMAVSDGGKKNSSITPRVSIPPGVIGNEKRQTISVARVAWILSGRQLRLGDGVWRTCTNGLCCAPTHLAAGTKAEEGAWASANGHRRGDPRRAVANLRNVAATQAVSLERVREVERRLAAGELQREVAAAMSIHKATISKIARRKHLHQRGQVRQASVFTMHAGVAR